MDWNEIGQIDHFSISNLELLFRYFVAGWSVGWKRKRRDLPTDRANSLSLVEQKFLKTTGPQLTAKFGAI